MNPRNSRIYRPKDILLFRLPPGVLTTNFGGQWVFFTVPTPSARVAVKLCIFFWVQVTGQTSPLLQWPDITLGGILNPFQALIYTGERSEAGRYSPINMLVGSLLGAAPQNIPLDFASIAAGYGTAGVSLTVQDCQEAIAGQVLCPSITVAAYGGTPRAGINMSLRTSYELVGSDMCQDEWDSLVSQMNPSASDPQILAAA